MRDRLVEAILFGGITTSCLREECDRFGGMPSVGDRQVVVDSDGRRVCVIEHTDIDLVPLKDITDEPVVVCQYFHIIGTYTRSHTINQRRS